MQRRTVEVQTDAILTTDVATETSSKTNIGIQADPTDSFVDPSDENALQQKDISDETISRFLRKVSKTMLDELNYNITDNDLDPLFQAILRKETIEDAGLCFEIPCQFRAMKGSTQSHLQEALDSKQGTKVTGLSWSADGEYLAIAYGHTEHYGWCTHSSGVAIFSASRTMQESNKPLCIVENASCVGSLAFHPGNPNLLAVGNFTGNIQVWDISAVTSASRNLDGYSKTSDQAKLLHQSEIDDYIHAESVIGLEWISAAQSDSKRQRSSYLLCSLSEEGKVNVWTLRNNLSHPICSGQVKSTRRQRELMSLGDTDYDAGVRRHRSKNVEMQAGCTTFSFLPRSMQTGGQFQFYVGGESGGVWRGTLQVKQSTLDEEEGAADALRNALRPGSIPGVETTLPWTTSAKASLDRVHNPTDKNKLARAIERISREMDSNLVTLKEVYASRPQDNDVLFPSPVNLQYTSHAHKTTQVVASPLQRNLFASSGIDGRLCVYNALLTEPLLVLESQKKYNTTQPSIPSLEVSASVSASVLCAAWSPSRELVLCAGYSNGDTYCYDLFESTKDPVLVLGGDGTITNRAGNVISREKQQQNSNTNSSDASPVVFVSFAPSQERMIAVGHESGTVRVWRLPHKLFESAAQESSAVKQFLNITTKIF